MSTLRSEHPGQYAHRSDSLAGGALLAVGFLALTAAVLVAHRSPATGYELSLYAGTPTAVWVGLGVAVACAMAVAFARPGGTRRLGALLLGGEAFLAVVGLPLIRGYEFYSSGDPLSHMGWVRNVLRGEMPLVELIYPGVHTVAVYFHRLVGLDVSHAMLLTVLVFAALFVLTVPLVTALLTSGRSPVLVAAFAAMMVLPVNNISVHFAFFPSTMAIFFVPFVLLLTVVTVRHTGTARLTPVDAALALAAVGVVLYHPQQAANLLLVLVTFSAAVWLYRYRTGDDSLDPLTRHTVLLAVLIAVWGTLHERIARTATTYTDTVVTTIVEGETSGGGAVAQRTGSLAAIGASTLEIGVKLFLPSVAFLALTALVLAWSFRDALRHRTDSLVLTVTGLGLVPVGVVMLLYMAGNLETIYFRHLGFIMMLATVFGAVALSRLVDLPDGRLVGPAGAAVAAVLVGALLALSLATVFPSPFIYQPNGHVTEAEIGGYETAFAHENESVTYAGIRTGPSRYREGVEGTYTLDTSALRRSTAVPFDRLDEDLTGVFDGPRYVVVSTSDVRRETVTYRNLRYSDSGFRRLGTDHGVDKVVSNGEFTLYYVTE